MPEQTQTGPRKREVAHKLRIGDILKGHPVVEETTSDTGQKRENFRVLELGDKQVVRVNIIANLIDKFTSEGEKRWATITLDDASGQIRVKVFGDDVAQFQNLNQGDTLLIIGLLRVFNQELYILPEIIKKTDPRYLLVRKLEIEKANPDQVEKTPEQQQQAATIKDQIIQLIKAGETNEQGEQGIDTEQIILKLKDATPDTINSEITKLLEQGTIYEPRPGRVRYLG